jgi:putative membrane protein
MKKLWIVIALPLFVLYSCGSQGGQKETEPSDTSYDKDKANGYANPDSDTSGAARVTTAEFLVTAAEGGMAEVDAGKMAVKKAAAADVKRFANMMVKDHTAANEKVKALATANNLTLPTAPPAHHQQMAAGMNAKSGKDFDKAYMDMMVNDHNSTISLFEKALAGNSDANVKQFIEATLPTLRMHLDSAKAIHSRMQ